MRHNAGRVYHEDRLVIRWQDRTTGKTVFQGKRVAADCPLSRVERRVYVEQGTVKAVKFLMLHRSLGLREAKDLLDSARGVRNAGFAFFQAGVA